LSATANPMATAIVANTAITKIRMLSSQSRLLQAKHFAYRRMPRRSEIHLARIRCLTPASRVVTSSFSAYSSFYCWSFYSCTTVARCRSGTTTICPRSHLRSDSLQTGRHAQTPISLRPCRRGAHSTADRTLRRRSARALVGSHCVPPNCLGAAHVRAASTSSKPQRPNVC
jgi:hypothetical protein